MQTLKRRVATNREPVKPCPACGAKGVLRPEYVAQGLTNYPRDWCPKCHESHFQADLRFEAEDSFRDMIFLADIMRRETRSVGEVLPYHDPLHALASKAEGLAKELYALFEKLCAAAPIKTVRRLPGWQKRKLDAARRAESLKK